MSCSVIIPVSIQWSLSHTHLKIIHLNRFVCILEDCYGCCSYRKKYVLVQDELSWRGDVESKGLKGNRWKAPESRAMAEKPVTGEQRSDGSLVPESEAG